MANCSVHFSLIDVSEVRLKLAMETAPAQRPHGVLGVWSPILSAIGNAFKIQVNSLLFYLVEVDISICFICLKLFVWYSRNIDNLIILTAIWRRERWSIILIALSVVPCGICITINLISVSIFLQVDYNTYPCWRELVICKHYRSCYYELDPFNTLASSIIVLHFSNSNNLSCALV